ncbi:MAG: hypothetical protein QOC60_308 [Frankiaceae bacterium]|nr:hypothetical protein [Frankiaceae bacterium]
MTVFGEVADTYDVVRPGYPPSIAAALGEHLGGPPTVVTEIGAGTGVATAMFRLLGAPMICIEPDPRMAAVLEAKFPEATVVATDFASWSPPPGGVPVLVGAMVWHLLDADRRNALAYGALASDGVLALVGRRYTMCEPSEAVALEAVFHAHGLEMAWRPDAWIADDLAASRLFVDVEQSRHDSTVRLSREGYVALLSTFSPFRRLGPPAQQRLQVAVGAWVDQRGGSVDLLVQTTLNLARRA